MNFHQAAAKVNKIIRQNYKVNLPKWLWVKTVEKVRVSVNFDADYLVAEAYQELRGSL